MNTLPSQEYLNECFTYNPESGELAWKVRPRHHFESDTNMKKSHSRAAGQRTGNVCVQGYVRTKLDKRLWFVHRIIWKMVHGVDPEQIDHVNGVRDDNRLINLRNVSHHVNAKNKAVGKNNKSGVSGVYWREAFSRYDVSIRSEGTSRWVGSYMTMLDAVSARLKAQKELGFHVNHNRQVR